MSKADTHASAPNYERQRRHAEQAMARAEKQAARRAEKPPKDPEPELEPVLTRAERITFAIRDGLTALFTRRNIVPTTGQWREAEYRARMNLRKSELPSDRRATKAPVNRERRRLRNRAAARSRARNWR